MLYSLMIIYFLIFNLIYSFLFIICSYLISFRIKIEKMIIRLENQPNVKIKRYIEDRVQKNPAKIEREYNPFKRNLSSIPSFDQLLPAGNIDALTIKNTSQIPDPVDESDLELQYELEKSVEPNSKIISENSSPYVRVNFIMKLPL